MQKLFYRPIIIIGLGLGLLVVVELVALGGMTWRNLDRIVIIKQDIKHGNQIQQLVVELLNNQLQTSLVSSSNPALRQKLKPDLHKQIISFLDDQYPATQGTNVLLQEVQELFITAEKGNQQDLIKALQLSREVLHKQVQEEEKLLEQVYLDSQLELNLAIIIPSAAFFILMIMGRYFLNRQIVFPLKALNELLSSLVAGEKKPIELSKADTVMQPLFSSYNQLLCRLSELEKEHWDHTHSLEKEVRAATHALLEQSHNLARAERLAAVGELAASAAHELRNPLAGIQVALENMYIECDDIDLADRLQLVIIEVTRLTSRLNELLTYSKQTPEKARDIDLFQLIDELMTLLKYQIEENITLHYKVDPQLRGILPETKFRQALLNLLLNSIQSIGNQIGTVNLRVKAVQDELIIEICDSGAGFPKELLEHGIQPFASYKEGGTGLGLSMVQRFAKSCNGSLVLANDDQNHACAILTLKNNR